MIFEYLCNYANHGYWNEAIKPFNQDGEQEEKKFDHLTIVLFSQHVVLR
jgi:hypothetical protein